MTVDASAAGDAPAQADVAGGPVPDEVLLRIPAEGVYVGLVRVAIASVATRCDLTVETIEELRTSIDEAAAILLSRAKPGSDLECRFMVRDGRLIGAVTAQVQDTTAPDPDSLGWVILTALAGSVEARSAGDTMTIELSHPLTG